MHACTSFLVHSQNGQRKTKTHTHIPHDVKAFVDNNIMNDTGRTRRKKNEVDKIWMMQAL